MKGKCRGQQQFCRAFGHVIVIGVVLLTAAARRARSRT